MQWRWFELISVLITQNYGRPEAERFVRGIQGKIAQESTLENAWRRDKASKSKSGIKEAEEVWGALSGSKPFASQCSTTEMDLWGSGTAGSKTP